MSLQAAAAVAADRSAESTRDDACIDKALEGTDARRSQTNLRRQLARQEPEVLASLWSLRQPAEEITDHNGAAPARTPAILYNGACANARAPAARHVGAVGEPVVLASLWCLRSHLQDNGAELPLPHATMDDAHARGSLVAARAASASDGAPADR